MKKAKNLRISSINRQRSLRINPQSVKTLARFVLTRENVRAARITIAFFGDRKMRKLNQQFLGKAEPTDVLAFPQNASRAQPDLAGDIAICVPQALRYSRNKRKDILSELSLYVIHGILHLMDYDDTSPEEARRMTRRQNALLKRARTDSLLINQMKREPEKRTRPDIL